MVSRRIAAALASALVLFAIAAAQASAHATLVGSSPSRNAVVRTQPAQVVFRFDQAVEGRFGAVKVFDAGARRVDQGSAFHPRSVQSQLAVKLKPGLPRGTYTAAFRVISADGHPVEGGVVFSVGAAGTAVAKSIDELIGTGRTGTATQAAFDVVRGLDYLAIALAIGLLVFMAACWRGALLAVGADTARWLDARAAFAGRAWNLAAVAVLLGLLSTALGLVSEGAEAGGTSFFDAARRSVIDDVLHTRFGTVWAIKGLLWVALALGLGLVATRARLREGTVGPRAVLLAVPAFALALTPGPAGHSATQSDRALMLVSDVAHVTAMSIWVGGLVALVLLVPRATARLQPADRSRLLAAVLLRFSPLALGAVAVLVATGTLQSIVYLDGFGDLLHTAFGRAVLIKIVLVIALIALGAVNRRRLVPRITALAGAGEALGETGRAIRATLRTEVALVVVVLGVTAALVGYPPPSSLATGGGPVNVQKHMGPLILEATVDPARVGPNTMHLYLFRAAGGAPFGRTKEITATATLKSKAVGPLPVRLLKSGPGHYTADSFHLVPGGDWTVTVTDRVSDFDEYSTTFKVGVHG